MTNGTWPFAAITLVLIVGAVGLVLALARSSNALAAPINRDQYLTTYWFGRCFLIGTQPTWMTAKNADQGSAA